MAKSIGETHKVDVLYYDYCNYLDAARGNVAWLHGNQYHSMFVEEPVWRLWGYIGSNELQNVTSCGSYATLGVVLDDFGVGV